MDQIWTQINNTDCYKGFSQIWLIKTWSVLQLELTLWVSKLVGRRLPKTSCKYLKLWVLFIFKNSSCPQCCPQIGILSCNFYIHRITVESRKADAEEFTMSGKKRPTTVIDATWEKRQFSPRCRLSFHVFHNAQRNTNVWLEWLSQVAARDQSLQQTKSQPLSWPKRIVDRPYFFSNNETTFHSVKYL